MLLMRKILAAIGILLLGTGAWAATYYISPTGSDTSGNGTSGSPWASLSQGFSQMSSGDTLICMDGTYTGILNQIDSSAGRIPPNGTSAHYTNVQAQHDGAAIFDGQGATDMLFVAWCPSAYWTFTGLVWKNPSASTALIAYGDHIKFFRCGAYDAADGNEVNFDAEHSSYILFENCWAYGSGRYKFLIYQSDHCILRQCVGRIDYTNAGTEPLAVFSLYSCTDSLAQNCIAIDSDQTSKYIGASSSYDMGGAFYNPATGAQSLRVTWDTCLALNVAVGGAGCAGNGEPYNADVILFKNCSWWHISNMGLDFNLFNLRGDTNTVLNCTAGDCTYIASDGGLVSSNYGGNGLVGSVLNSSAYKFTAGDALVDMETEDYNCLYSNTNNYNNTPAGAHTKTTTNPIWNASTNPTGALKYMTRIESGSSLSGQGSGGSDIGANCLKMVGAPGTLWGDTGYNTVQATNMWPFPSEDLIKAQMASYNNNGVSGARGFCTGTSKDGNSQTLTKYIWEYMGNPIPPEIYGGSSNNPPTAVASAVPTSGIAPLFVVFSSTGTDTDGTIASYSWDFGDSGTSTLRNPSHTYTSAGVYTAVVTVTDNDGATGTAAVSISVVSVPAAPSGLTATAQSTSTVSLAWTDNSNNETAFIIERSATSGSNYAQVGVTGANVTAYADSGLNPATTYYYVVVASNTVGVSGNSNEAYALTFSLSYIAPPTSLSAVAVSSSAINLAWTDNSNNETAFIIERSATSGSNYAQVGATGANITTYADSGLNPATTYYYIVVASNTVGVSGNSNEAYALTFSLSYISPPSNLSAVAASSSTINLAWTDNSNNETGFKIERSTVSGASYIEITTTTANVTAYADTGLDQTTTYYYRIRATNTVVDSAYSNEAYALTYTAVYFYAPSNLLATVVSSSSISLSWTDNSSIESGFQISRKGTGSYQPLTTVGPNVTTYLDSTNLNPNSLYYYRVRAASGTVYTAYSNVSSTTTYPALPAAPSNLTATVVSSTTIKLIWADNSTNETCFKIERSTVSSSSYYIQITTVSAGITQYIDPTLSVSATYYYRVRANNAGGDSAYTNAASTVTYPAAPAAPSNLTATAVSASSISLAWTDNSTNENGFKIERSTALGGNYTQIGSTGASVAAYTDTALSASSTYYYRVRSYNAGGNSGYSNIASTATYPAPAINAPSSLTATAVSSSTINLAWTDNSNNETGFQIWRSTVSGTSYSQIGTVSANVVTYTDPSLSASSTYYYVVRATNTVGSSNFSNEASTITYPAAQSINAPSNLTAIAVSSSTINLAWTDNSNNEAGFKIERKLVSGTYAQITTVGANATTYADTGLNAATAYYYRVRATNATADSVYSNEASTATYSASSVSGDTKIINKISSGGIIVIGSTKNRGVINPDQGDTAKIYFNGSQTGKYECRIFTLNGELIWQSTQDNVSSGIFEWIPGNIASGGYIASVRGPGLNEKKKIAILR